MVLHPLGSYGTREIDQTVSQFYLAGELVTSMTGLTISVPEHERAPFAHTATDQLAEDLPR
jgi:hypothetical protein